MKKNNKLFNFIKILISIILIGYLVYKTDFNEYITVFKKIGLIPFLLSFLSFIICKIISAIKWHLFLPNCKLKDLIKIVLRSQFYSLVLPGQLFGEASKVGMLHKLDSNDISNISSIAIDKITGFIAILIIGIVGILNSSIKLPNILIILFVIISILIIIFILIPKISSFDRFTEKVLDRMNKTKHIIVNKVFNYISSFYQAWKHYSNEYKTIIYSILVGIIAQMFGVFQDLIISRSLNLNISCFEFMWIYPTLSILLLLPITIGGLGLREASLSSFLSLFGVSVSESLIISTMLLLTHLVLALIDCIFIFIDNIRDI